MPLQAPQAPLGRGKAVGGGRTGRSIKWLAETACLCQSVPETHSLEGIKIGWFSTRGVGRTLLPPLLLPEGRVVEAIPFLALLFPCRFLLLTLSDTLQVTQVLVH